MIDNIKIEVETVKIGSKTYLIENLQKLKDKELADVIDFGTSMKESFTSYIIRIEKAIDLWLYIKGDLHPHILNTIMGIFEDVSCNPQGTKYPQVIAYLKELLDREPNINDLNSMVDRTRVRLEHKIMKYDRERQKGICS